MQLFFNCLRHWLFKSKKAFKIYALFLGSLLLSSCGYPLAFLFNKEALPPELGANWQPKRRSVRSASKIQYSEPIDLEILKGPLTIAQVVDFSLKNNPLTQESWANILSGIAYLGQARKDYWPTAHVSSNLQRQRQDSPFSLQARASQWLTLGVTDGFFEYTLWDFGARFAKSESALQSLYAISYSYNQTLQSVIQTVANDYYDYSYQKAALCDRAQDVKDASLVLESVQKKLHLGIANVSDLVQAKTLYLNAKVDFIAQKDQKENALANLAQNMGMAANLKFETYDFPKDLPGKEYLESQEDFIELALNNRPELVQYKAEILSKKANLAYERLDPLPKVKGDLDLQYTKYHKFGDSFNLTALFKIEMPLFEGFYFRNRQRQAKADLKKSIAQFKQKQDLILGEVTRYYNNYTNAVEKIEYAREYLESALEEFEVTLSRYKTGVGDIVQVAQALSSLSDARTKYTQSIQQLFISLTNLAYATGSLLAPQMESSWQELYHFSEDPL